MWTRFFIYLMAAGAMLFGRGSDAQEQAGGILFLHLRRSSEGVSLVGADLRGGSFKPQPRRGALAFEVVDSDNAVLHEGAAEDPLFQYVEYADPTEPGRLRSRRVQHESADFTLLVPALAAGRSVRFFQQSAAAELGAQSARRLISEIQIPAESKTLRSFAATAKLYTLLTNGPSAQRINIVFLAEAYMAAQESAFTNKAAAVLNQMLSTSPYSAYRGHFNAFAIFVASQQSGSDHPDRQIFRDTYFNSTYGSGNLVRLITIPPNQWNSNYEEGIGRVVSLLAQFVPEYDIPLLLVNDSEYGGSGGFPSIASINALSAELALHEIGHSFAGLADEYEEDIPGYPDIEAPNTTRETTRELIKWRKWIDPLTPIPTPAISTYQGLVGLFEGAYFHKTGWYRPKLDCRMRNLSAPFCEVCRETHVLQTYSRLPIIPSSSPVENNVTVPGGGELLLEVDSIQPAQGFLTHTWTIDGVTNSVFTSNTFSASFNTLGTGTHLIRVQVADETGLVRTDPLGKLLKSRSWLVQVHGPTNQPPIISRIPDLTMLENTTVTLSLSFSDPDSPPGALVVSARSSSTNLIANESIVLGGTGTNRTMTLTPVTNASGRGTITVEVSDEDYSTAVTFTVDVSDQRVPVVIERVPDQRVFTGPLKIPFRIWAEAPHRLLLFGSSENRVVLPDSGIQFVFANEQHSVTLNPVASGQTLVTVTASDGVDIARTSFNVTFLPRPIATAAAPERTASGLLLRFSSEPAATMILELSTDLKFWTPVSSAANASELEYLVPDSFLVPAGFYRLRLVPL